MKIDVTQLVDLEFDGIDREDHPDYCDAYVSRARWSNGMELTLDELETLNWDYHEYVYNQLMRKLY